jgi:FtsH-binding integral membrane protein
MTQVDSRHPHLVIDAASEAVDPRLRSFMIGLYNKVGLGLLVSAALAYATSAVPAVRDTLFVTSSPAAHATLAG